jgi:SnoaL-like domain
MQDCYAPDVHFSDPVFVDLHGHEAGAMWRMLTERAADLRVELLEHSADGDRGSARWRAHYTFVRPAARWSTTCAPPCASPTG